MLLCSSLVMLMTPGWLSSRRLVGRKNVLAIMIAELCVNGWTNGAVVGVWFLGCWAINRILRILETFIWIFSRDHFGHAVARQPLGRAWI